mgnify:CR=1 FL=1
MFFILSKIFSFLIKPIIWIIILLFGVIKTKSHLLLYITFFLLYFFSNSFIIDSCNKMWEIPPKNISSLTKQYKYGIVLGGFSSFNNKTKQIDLLATGDRLISAIELYNLGKIEKILISGGNGELINNGRKEGEWSYNFLINMGVDSTHILTENNSRNTMENANNTTKIISKDIQSRSLLITSAIHMRRAKFCFNKNNFNIDDYSTDATKSDIILTFDYLFLPNAGALQKWEHLIHELIGLLVYKIKF